MQIKMWIKLIMYLEMTSVRWIDFMGGLFVLWVTDVLKIFFD